MAKWLNEEMVEKLEKQRELRDRAAKAGFTIGMTEQERQNHVFKKAHEEAMERKRLNVLANPGAEANTNYRHAVMRDAEMRAAREHEMERLGKELATREEEARQRRWGMAEQGREAAEFNKDAAIRTAEVQAASAEKVAGINTASAEKIAGINTSSEERISKDKGDVAKEVARIGKEGTTEAAAIQARAQEARTFAENMMKQRNVDEKTALDFAERRSAMITQLINSSKVHGKPRYTEAEAAKIIDERLKSQMPGKPRIDTRFVSN